MSLEGEGDVKVSLTQHFIRKLQPHNLGFSPQPPAPAGRQEPRSSHRLRIGKVDGQQICEQPGLAVLAEDAPRSSPGMEQLQASSRMGGSCQLPRSLPYWGEPLSTHGLRARESPATNLSSNLHLCSLEAITLSWKDLTLWLRWQRFSEWRLAEGSAG